MVVEWIVPLASMAMVFGICYLIANIVIQRTRATAQPDATYRALAEEAVRSQKELLEETRRMTASLKEVERLLREV
ncbi:MAG: hypothetical protein ACPGQL_05475 [Thermoplasmatota archaeon]